jgi:MYND finger
MQYILHLYNHHLFATILFINYLASMYTNLSRERDAEHLRRYPTCDITGLNLDRIRGVIEKGRNGDIDDDLLVRSIDQVVAYDPSLRQDRNGSIGRHFLDYCFMQQTSPAVMQKVLEIWPPPPSSRIDDFRRQMSNASPALRNVLVNYFSSNNNSNNMATSGGGGAQSIRNDRSLGGAATAAATASPTSPPRLLQECEWNGCPGAGSSNLHSETPAAPLKVCSRCRRAKFCSEQCQKLAWKNSHKYVCVSHSVVRHVVPAETTTNSSSSSSNSVEAIQQAIDAAQPGDVVEIPAGTYGSCSGTSAQGVDIVIPKPLYIVGLNNVIINGNLVIKYETPMMMMGNNASSSSSSSSCAPLLALVIANLEVKGHVVASNIDTQLTLASVKVSCRANSDAVSLQDCTGSGGNNKILLFGCEIMGGDDGLFISGSPRVHVKETTIKMASSRGIFANDYFVIEKSTIADCGSYGIKGRAGWEEKGHANVIQPGPWNCFGGPSMGF